jgi:hypothetical protein
MTEPPGGSTKPKRPVVVPAVALVAITALGITALLGGLDEVPDPAPPQYGAGAVLDQGWFSTQFVEAKTVTEKATADWDTDKRYVELVLKVTNQGDSTAFVGLPPDKPEDAFAATSFAGSLVKMTPAVKSDGPPDVYALSKNVRSGQLQPKVPTTVVFRYKLVGTAPPPKKVTLDMSSFSYEPGFNDPTFHWTVVSEDYDGGAFFPVIQAQVTLPVHGAGTA